MPAKITIIDAGIGNLYSITRALEVVGAKVELARDNHSIAKAEHLIVPGVGAFSTGMQGLHEHGIDAAVIAHAASGRPLMGICLGMQMLMTSSEEHGEHRGLDIIPGHVRQIPSTTQAGEKQKIPHIGWNALHPPTPETDWNNTVLANTNEGDAVYFVHSFAVTPDKAEDALAITYYGGHSICAVVRHGNIYGCQFHPEKSGEVGLNILKRFVET